MRILAMLLAALLPTTALAGVDAKLRDATEQQPAEVVARDAAGASVALELRPMHPFARDATLTVVGADGTRRRIEDATRYFAVQGRDDASLRGVLTLRADGRLRGLLRSDTGFAWLQPTAKRELRIEALPQAKNDAEPFQCDVADTDAGHAQGAEPAPASVKADPPDGYRARIAIETDSEFLARFAGDVEDATAYVGSLIGFISTVYRAEADTRMEVSFLRLWETPDPFVQTTTSCALIETGKYWNDNEADVERSTVHFMSGRASPIAGIAWIGVLCNGPSSFKPSQYGFSCPGIDSAVAADYGGAYGVTMGLSGGFDAGDPKAVWDVVGVAHEIGHNFDSPHTHCYANVGGNAAPVDQCYSGEGACYSGVASLPGPQGQGSGTLMSYCHLRPGGLSNLTLTLGTDHPYGVEPGRVPTRMLQHVQNRAASNAACLIEPVAQAALEVSATPSELAAGDTAALSVSGGSGSGAVSYAVTAGDTSCSIAGATLTALAPGNCEVTATKAADAHYLAASDSTAIAIRALQAPLVIATAPATMVYGDVAQVQVTGGSGSGAVALQAEGDACQLQGGQLQAIGIGTCELMATKAADASYFAAEATLTLDIGRAAQSPLVLNATPINIAHGRSSTLAVSGGSGNGSTQYAVTAGGALCSLAGTTVTAATAGTGVCTVTATRSGGSYHLAASDSVGIGVFPPAVDLALEIARIAPPGDAAAGARSYRIAVTNDGPVDTNGLRLQAGVVDGLSDVLWTCSAPADCTPPAGAAATDAVFDLAAGATAQAEISGEVAAGVRYVVIDARIVPAAGTTALTPGDDARRLVDGVGGWLFRDGFD